MINSVSGHLITYLPYFYIGKSKIVDFDHLVTKGGVAGKQKGGILDTPLGQHEPADYICHDQSQLFGISIEVIFYETPF